jgi:hypothetical protein
MHHSYNERIFTSSLDNTVEFWDIQGNLIDTIVFKNNTIESIQLIDDDKYLIAYTTNNSAIFYDLSNNKQLLSFSIFDNDPAKWVHMHESGLFDASPEAMEMMYWTKGSEVIEFQQLKDRYWLPGLWEKVLNGEELPDVRDMQNLMLQPKVELGKVNNGSLPITLTKREGGYGKVAIFINGKEVVNDARGNDLDTTQQTQIINYSIIDHPYLKNGDNVITVKASSADGFIQGRGVTVETFVEESEQEKPEFYGVVIGVGAYANSKINLKYTVQDAEAISKSIEMGANNLFGEDKTHVYTITSSNETPPTKNNIKSVFNEIAEKAKAEDVIVVYLSGHGIAWGGSEGDFYFLTSDATAANKNTYADKTIRDARTISTNEWVEWLKGIPALKQVMIIDACGSGKAVDNLVASRDVEGSQIKAIDRMKDRTGMFILSGCTADAVSYEASQYGQGLLTYAILQAMKGAALEENRFVDVETIFTHAQETVPTLAKGIGGIQKPQLLAPKGGSFDIGIMEDKDKAAVPLSEPKKVFVRSVLVDKKKFRDVLEISKKLNEELSLLSSTGEDVSIVFFDANEYGNGCQITGGYSGNEANIELDMTIVCGEEEVQHQLAATNVNELVRKIIEVVTD